MLLQLSKNPRPIAYVLAWMFYLNFIASIRSIGAAPAGYKFNASAAVMDRLGLKKINHPNSTGFATPKPKFEILGKASPEKYKPKMATSGGFEKKGKFTTGPTQPEMQSFQSVNSNNMVDLFTGDFSYNIPLLDVGGYPVNLHYTSGISMDQEASWVGLGWNINPGTISRNMRGLPDDFKGDQDKVVKTVSMKPNRTFGVSAGADMEIFGGPIQLGANVNVGVFHNNYKGWGTESGISFSLSAGVGSKGSLTSGLSLVNNSQDGLNISPSFGINLAKGENGIGGGATIGTSYNSRLGVQGLQISGQIRREVVNARLTKQVYGAGINGYISFAKPSFTPTIQVPYSSFQASISGKVGTEQVGLFPDVHSRAYLSIQKILDADKTVSAAAYGYLYYDQAKGSGDVLLDFNREKDAPFRNKSPNIAVPIYTYDTYSISGEGTGGMFRPYRGDIGYVYDPTMSTKSGSLGEGFNVGFGNLVKGGIDINVIYAATKSNGWTKDNYNKDVIQFKPADTTFENVFFKNPGEKGSVNQSYINAIGDENLIRIDVSPETEKNPSNVSATRNFSMFRNQQLIGRRTIDNQSLKLRREKRTQVISYLTGTEANLVGFEKQIRSYKFNTFPSSTCATNYDILPRVNSYKKGHHLSEITVLNSDGRRYIYGIPVYNISQRDVTMSVGKGDAVTGLVDYAQGEDNSTSNNKGKDGYFNREDLPAYSHSFLLNGILSSDYVDVTGDGVTEDDKGDAVKFNYSRIYNEENPFKWRAPFQLNKASYNEGLKTDSRDEKGTYTYGSREVWYLNSIESKTMIATFVLDTEERKDSYGVKDENGDRSPVQKLYKLKQINLYTKADFLKNGTNAKPIKSVNFEYSYRLCKGSPSSIADSGKLTLEKVWFSYNKNNKGKLNPYQFTYHSNNPDYNSKSYDRWGNFKNPSDNPGALGKPMSNADYSYSLQDGNKTSTGNPYDTLNSDANAAAWTLSKVKLPSGGFIDVTYESDDYAYVQNKRAMQFFSLAGFGNSPSSSVGNNLLYPDKGNSEDYKYVFINVPDPVSSSKEIQRKYLEGVEQLYFKVNVKMPSDKWGSGYEAVPCYAKIDSFGVKGQPSDKVIWIKLATVKGSDGPLQSAAIQFLRLNLPSKAYPYSEPGDNLNVKAVVGMVTSVVGNVRNTISSFEKVIRKSNKCQAVQLESSFVRLNNPYFRKRGGGLRVKKITIEDNWDRMTNQVMKGTTYGQEYNYTKNVTINGSTVKISSGVASYEPAIGADENPFHVPFKLYSEKEGILAPTDFVYVEEPFAETFFPSPSVGYSKVTVQTIHKAKKSTTGFEETEFYTTRDFPTLVEVTPLGDDSKKTYNPKVNNFLKINAKNFVTLTQGFKIELNDMNGKVKSQSTYAQNDLKNPISFTYNYYKLQNDFSGNGKLSSNVSAIDSLNGTINSSAQIGKEVEIMVDVREQTSSTIGASYESNVDVFPFFSFPIFTITAFVFPTKETNRFRSIAVLKIVNKYGLLDSVIHIEKGSKVTTRNMVYDGETGDVLLSQTNNEFDDPVYNFSYPAHWAYSGMGLAYKNIGATFSNVMFKQGRMFYSNGRDSFPVSRFFESGDEILSLAIHGTSPSTGDTCQESSYMFTGPATFQTIWAIDASKGKEGDRGIFFIDKNGKPYTSAAFKIKIIRSGKRNMPSVPVGTITSLKSPIKLVNGSNRIVFDSTTAVIAASAGRFTDLWQVDSTTYAKDTVVIGKKMVESRDTTITSIESYTIVKRKGKSNNAPDRYYGDAAAKSFEASSVDFGNVHAETKSWELFNVDKIPQGAVVVEAQLYLTGNYELLHESSRGSVATNASYIQRPVGKWVKKLMESQGSTSAKDKILVQFFKEEGIGKVDLTSRGTISATTPLNTPKTRNDTVNITAMMQGMIDDYYSKRNDPSIMIRLINFAGDINGKYNRKAYLNSNFNQGSKLAFMKPSIYVKYYLPCSNGSKATYSATPIPGYYCYSDPKDSFVCKPNIVDTSINPYRWGVLGNWRMYRAYTYYDRRKQSDPNAATNIRTDGEIKSFVPYWSFTNTLMTASADSSRWVWNSEMTAFNQKGFEIENRDPLGRYNSGQYGYNQTLPVAVAQNSKAAHMMFDGFEDYDYKTDTCKKCPSPRFIDLTTGGGSRVDTISHTGNFSFRVAANSNSNIPIKIDTAILKLDTTRLSIDIVDNDFVTDTVVTPNGSGLNVSYRPYNSNIECRGGIDPKVDIDWGTGGPSGCPINMFTGEWQGSILPALTDNYTFYLNSDDGSSLEIVLDGTNSVQIIRPENTQVFDNATAGRASFPVTLYAGKLYKIKIKYREIFGVARIRFSWSAAKVPLQTVPQANLYPRNVDQQTIDQTAIQLVNRYCGRMRNPKPEKVVFKRFRPQSGTKIVVSAWVREETICTGIGYTGVSMQVIFNAGSPTTVTLTPRGNVIEGWQRIEDTLTIPINATSMSLVMRSTSSLAAFFDDIRINPFNSNMKSFVYNPVNIRLMAELDENNYATFYEYDDDGTLIRVKKETERGIKTIKETRSALLKEQ